MEPLSPRPAPARTIIDRLREWIRWFGPGRLAGGAVAIVVVAAGSFWLLRAPPPPTESTLPYASGTTTTTSSPESGAADGAATSPTSVASSEPAELVVHVAGSVSLPGVYRLAAGARVVDAIAAAGGLSEAANANGVNLAAAVHDGERVYVPAIGEAVPALAPPPAGSTAPSGPVDLNAATVAQLDTRPGVGPSTAAAIIAYRDANGPFQSVEELGDVRGIGPAKLEALAGLVLV